MKPLLLFIAFLAPLFQANATTYRHLNVLRPSIARHYFFASYILPRSSAVTDISNLNISYSDQTDLHNILTEFGKATGNAKGVDFTSGKSGYNVGYGKKFNSPIRVDIQLEFMNINKDLSPYFSVNPFTSNAVQQTYTGMELTARSYSLYGNLYWDFDHFHKTLTPYIGVGGGLMSLSGFFRGFNGMRNNNNSQPTTFDTFRTNQSIANVGIFWQFSLGTMWNFANSLHADFSYKTFYRPSFGGTNISGSYSGSALTSTLQIDL